MNAPELILHNGAITTLDDRHPQVSAVAIAGGRIAAIGGEELLETADERRPGSTSRAGGSSRASTIPTST